MKFLSNAKHMAWQLFLCVPIIGHMAKDIHYGRESALGFFGGNILMMWLIAGLAWGIPGMLAGAYIILPCAALCLLTIMRP